MQLPFAFRSYLNQLLLGFGVHEVAARQATFAGKGGFDLSSWAPRKAKAYSYPRPSPPDMIVVHVTDVAGGFGVSKRRLNFFEQALENTRGGAWQDLDAVGLAQTTLCDHVPVPVVQQLPTEDTREAAHRLALWERLKDQAYHQIGAANGDNLAIHDIMRYSWHGNGGNRRGCGWALDCSHKQELDEWMTETGRASLRSLIHRMSKWAALREAEEGEAARFDVPVTMPIIVVPHRVFSADRRVDTNARKNLAGVWRNVVLPVVAEFDHVEIGYGQWSKKGRPVPIDWDDDALYDWRGRKISRAA